MCSTGFVRLLNNDDDVFVSYCLVSNENDTSEEYDFVHSACTCL